MMTQMLLGSGGGGVYLQAGDFYAADPIITTFRLNSDGWAYVTDEGGVNRQLYMWLQGGAAADYDAYAVTVSGAPSSGTMDTALQLSTNRSWSRSAIPAASYYQFTFDLVIRAHLSSDNLINPVRITLTCENLTDP